MRRVLISTLVLTKRTHILRNPAEISKIAPNKRNWLRNDQFVSGKRTVPQKQLFNEDLRVYSIRN